ncbi:MAG: trehalose-phosphatase [Blastomonas sp.]
MSAPAPSAIPNDPPPPLSRGDALFLDFDGTLVDIAPTPDAVMVPPGLSELLRAIAQKLEGRLALVSGRPVHELRGMFGLDGLAIAGSHGLETAMADGPVMAMERPQGLDHSLSAARALAGAQQDLLIEDKPLGVGIHYRARPDLEQQCRDLAERLADLHGLAVQHGKMVSELRPHGQDKGSAIARFMTSHVFAGSRPVFAGDDLTDEHGFAAAAEHCGAGILVGPPRPSIARFRLDNVAALHKWLAEF